MASIPGRVNCAALAVGDALLVDTFLPSPRQEWEAPCFSVVPGQMSDGRTRGQAIGAIAADALDSGMRGQLHGVRNLVDRHRSPAFRSLPAPSWTSMPSGPQRRWTSSTYWARPSAGWSSGNRAWMSCEPPRAGRSRCRQSFNDDGLAQWAVHPLSAHARGYPGRDRFIGEQIDKSRNLRDDSCAAPDTPSELAAIVQDRRS